MLTEAYRKVNERMQKRAGAKKVETGIQNTRNLWLSFVRKRNKIYNDEISVCKGILYKFFFFL